MKHIAATIASAKKWMSLTLSALTPHAQDADCLSRLGIDATEVPIQGDRYAADVNPAFCPTTSR